MCVAGVDEPCASGGGISKARKAQRSKEIKHSHGSGAQISSGTASGVRPPHQIFNLMGAGVPRCELVSNGGSGGDGGMEG